MFIKKRKTFLLLLLAGILTSNVNILANSLSNDEKTRLYNSLNGQIYRDITIDISFTKEVVTKPEAVKEEQRKREEATNKLREESGRSSLKIGTFSLPLPDGSEIRLSETRIRIGSGLKLRSDTKIFANREKTEAKDVATMINTGFGKDDPSYFIDHKLKTAIIWSGRRWSGYEVLRFGKVDKAILIDIMSVCNPKPSQYTNMYKRKDFFYSGTGTIEGKTTDEIECISLENGQTEYKISLDPNNWHICRKIVWYDKESGLVSKTVEHKEFAKAKGNGESFPRLIESKYFDKAGKEEKIETIKVSNVVIGEPISEDIFSLDVLNEYVINDMRVSPPKIIQPR